MWIHPSSFAVAPGEPLSIRLLVGNAEAAEAVVRDGRRVARFVARGPSGEQSVVGLDGVDPAGFVRPEAEGWYQIVYESTPAFSSLGAEQFQAYLREEGLEGPRSARTKRGEEGLPGLEHYRRSLKSWVRVGDVEGELAPPPRVVAAGLPLELLLDVDPFLGGAQWQVAMSLLHLGQPLADTLVEIRPLSGGEAGPVLMARTDQRGELLFALPAGEWMAAAVHMESSSARVADWESLWTSLTFSLP